MTGSVFDDDRQLLDRPTVEWRVYGARLVNLGYQRSDLVSMYSPQRFENRQIRFTELDRDNVARSGTKLLGIAPSRSYMANNPILTLSKSTEYHQFTTLINYKKSIRRRQKWLWTDRRQHTDAVANRKRAYDGNSRFSHTGEPGMNIGHYSNAARTLTILHTNERV